MTSDGCVLASGAAVGRLITSMMTNSNMITKGIDSMADTMATKIIALALLLGSLKLHDSSMLPEPSCQWHLESCEEY